MSFAEQPLDMDDGLSILTEMIISEIGPREALAQGGARAAAVARVEQLLRHLLADSPSRIPEIVQGDDPEIDILFGRTDAEFAFAEGRRFA